MSFHSVNLHPAIIAALVCAFVLGTGCRPEDQYMDFVETDIASAKVDDLSRSMDFINSEVRFDQREFVDGVVNGLNRWVKYSQEERLDGVTWELEPMLSSLVDEYSDLEVCKRIGEYNYLNTDPYYLQQGRWLTLLTNRLAESQRYQPFEAYRLAADDFDVEKTEKPVNAIFKSLNAGITEDADAEKLANAVKVFDWVCRTINLESSVALDDDEIEDRILNDDKEGPAAGVPGLGYQRFPWQTMLYGRGDYVERAKLVVLGLRYLDIDSLVLATGDEQTPWVVAVPIAGDYYLFDTQLGLPLPGKEVGSIATLAMVQESPDQLESLDLTTDESLAENTKYRVRPDDLKSLTGLLYASPDSISKRMKGLQSVLVAENRLLISYGLSELAKALPAIDGVEFKPWDIAFKTHQYRYAIREALERATSDIQDKLYWHYRTEAYIDGFRIYRTARGRFFQGKFDAVDEDELAWNALDGFKSIVYTEEDIASLATDKDLQRVHGIRYDKQDAKEFQSILNSVQGQMRLIRVDAKLFLAQCLFDNENETGIHGWLDDLISNASDEPYGENGRWNDAIQYLSGRSYEAGKQYDEAIEAYGAEDLNQTHGNLLRARMLKQLLKKHFSDLAKN